MIDFVIFCLFIFVDVDGVTLLDLFLFLFCLPGDWNKNHRQYGRIFNMDHECKRERLLFCIHNIEYCDRPFIGQPVHNHQTMVRLMYLCASLRMTSTPTSARC